ncbi:cytochrome b561 and DOMON domain-containing protein [Senna tora]|uniref:Cytochrome b561 and DOMON domain-containing protein n=1 Tax=Senna tora TaxID=362788 RepID=A0A834TTW2_9FABA|nr:cytochrome b561 and DOMON domain-containing protein [Senna tora]
MANLRSLWPSFVRLNLVLLVLDFKILAFADDNNNNNNNNGSYGGFVSESSCKNTNYQSFLPPPYQNISHMICKPLWHTYELRYIRNGETTTIILSAPYTIGWVGIGFSRDGMMVGSSAMVGWMNKHGHPKIKQFYLQAKKASEVIVDKGEMPLNNMPPAVATNGAQIYLAFQLQTPKPFGKQPLLLAFGTKTPQNHHLTKHVDKTALIFDFSSGELVSGSKDPGSNELFEMRKNHGIVGIIGWGLILPVGAIIARYFRHKDPLWFYLHSVIQFVGFIFGLATVLLGLQLHNKMQVHIPAHRGIGIFVLVLSILQVLAFFLRPNKDSKIRRFWNWYHNWFGRMALFFASVNIVLGMEAAGAGSDWRIGSERRSLPPSFPMDPLADPAFPTNLTKCVFMAYDLNINPGLPTSYYMEAKSINADMQKMHMKPARSFPSCKILTLRSPA